MSQFNDNGPCNCLSYILYLILPLVSDVGYNGIRPQVGFINNVLNKYFTEHFPRALNVSRDIKKAGETSFSIYKMT